MDRKGRSGVQWGQVPPRISPPGGPMPRSIRLALALLPLLAGAAQAAPALPATPKKPVVDTYHGVAVPDDYRWLEADSDPAVKAWSDAENAVARDFLDAIPERKDILARVGQLTNARTPRYYQLAVRGGRTFAMKDQPPLQQPMLVILGAGL